jgi:hypothetical protein
MKRQILLILISMIGLTLQSIAQGNLLITPSRVVFEGNKQKEQLNLVNIGADTAIYSISFVQYRMKEDGTFDLIEKPDSGQMFADPYLRIFPRRVTLAPREPQVVMLQYRRKKDMPAGEYRSHLYFRAEQNIKPLGSENSATDTTQLKIQLIPIFGLSIPIIIRSGTTNVSVTLSDYKMEMQQDTIPCLRLAINRTGNISIYGDLVITYVSAKGKTYEIAKVKGIGVYTNINKRNILIKLNKLPGMVLTNGKLVVKYISHDEDKKITVFAEGEMKL